MSPPADQPEATPILRDTVAILRRRAMSAGELIERLERKGYEAEASRAAATEARRRGWIDERHYAETVCRRVLARGPAGRAMLEQRLVDRALAADLIREVIDEILGERTPLDDAIELAERTLRGREHRPPASNARRVASVLARRGFGDDTVGEVLYRLDLSEGVDLE